MAQILLLLVEVFLKTNYPIMKNAILTPLNCLPFELSSISRHGGLIDLPPPPLLHHALRHQTKVRVYQSYTYMVMWLGAASYGL